MAQSGDVLLYVQQGSIPAAVKDELTRLAPDGITIVGGPVRVSNIVEQELAAYAPVTRVAGASRFTTPIEIAQTLYPVVPPPVVPPPEPPVEPPTAGDIHYPAGNHGDVIITDSDVTVTAEAGASFTDVLLRGVNNVTVDGLTVDGNIRNERASEALNVTVRRCTAKAVELFAPRTRYGRSAPNGWVVEYNDLANGGYCVGVYSDGADYVPIENTIIRGNKMGNPSLDAIRISNYDGLLVEGNEIYGVIENGSHNDGLQSVWGGKNLTFTRNYLHDNRCQTFFLKGGYVENVTFTENLSIRNRVETPAMDAVHGKIYPTGGFTMTNNTLWDSSSFGLREGSDTPYDYVITDNVLWELYQEVPDSVVFEDRNVFGKQHWQQDTIGPNSIIDPDPAFVDWQIPGAGITWNPDAQVYGVAAG